MAVTVYDGLMDIPRISPLAAFVIIRILVVITALVLASQLGLNWDTTPLTADPLPALNSDGTLTLNVVTR